MHLLHGSLAPALDIRVTRMSEASHTGSAEKLANRNNIAAVERTTVAFESRNR